MMNPELMKALAADRHERLRGALARPRKYQGRHRRPAGRRFLSWLYRMTLEVGENSYSTFGYYPQDDEAAAQLEAHSADPVTRAHGERRLERMAAQQRAASEGSTR